MLFLLIPVDDAEVRAGTPQAVTVAPISKYHSSLLNRISTYLKIPFQCYRLVSNIKCRMSPFID